MGNAKGRVSHKARRWSVTFVGTEHDGNVSDYNNAYVNCRRSDPRHPMDVGSAGTGRSADSTGPNRRQLRRDLA